MALSKRNITIIIFAFITVFFDTMNYALIVPILPYLVKELNSNSFQEGLLFSSYSIFQLISLLIMGPLSDKYGRKPFLLLSLFGSCFGSIFQGMSQDMWSLIIWRSFTGLFAGSLILVQAVVADVTDASIRNSWLSRLDSIVSAAFIIGPAIGGILSKVNYHFPLYCAGVVSGIAMIVAFIFLKESHPREARMKNQSDKKEEKPRVKPKLTSLMVLCFIFEFCIRWTVNAFDARYGFFLTDKFGTSSDMYSFVVVMDSVLTCIFQAFIYPWLISSLHFPIPYAATLGMIIECISFIAMSAAKSQLGSIIASVVLWIGFTFAAPSSVSIISTSTSEEIQGTVLSWNNFCYQASLIISPLVLSAIYEYNIDAIYYFSAGIIAIGGLITAYMSTWKNARELGKVSITEEKQTTEGIELETIEVKGDEKNDVIENTVEVKGDEKNVFVSEKNESANEKMVDVLKDDIVKEVEEQPAQSVSNIEDKTV